MKKLLYKLVSRLGYRIERKRSKEELWPGFEKYNVQGNLSLFFGSKSYIQELHARYRDLKLTDFRNGFIVGINGLDIYVESIEEFHILKEVFLSNDYNFLCNKDALVIDIGSNIGVSCLYFSKMKYVKKIYGFEPVSETYNQALVNFELNKEQAHKIEITNCGLGSENKEETYIFNQSSKGNTGIRGLQSPTMMSNQNNQNRKVLIKNASVKIQEIIMKNEDLKVVVKMDCEGSEYEILDNLSKNGILDLIDIWMLEWHDKGPSSIESLLVSNGYNVFSSTLSAKAGIIYASKN